MDLNGKRAIVLGGTSGIGLAAVRQLLAAGASVTGCGRSLERIAAAEQAVPGAAFRQVDVLDRDALEALFTAHDAFDVLVNAATPRDRAWGPLSSGGRLAAASCDSASISRTSRASTRGCWTSTAAT